MPPRALWATACPPVRGSAPADDRSGPSDEELFDALCSARRLYVLRHLRETGGEASLGALVDAVASMEYGKRPEDLDRDERRRIYVSLYQTHLPKLGERGLVRWDDGDTITLLVDDYLPGDGRGGVRWERYYLVLTVCWAAVVVLAAVDVGPFAALGSLVVGAGLVGSEFVLSVVHSLVE
ncbi:MAG: hypothetical protein ABEJ81_02170 [Haloferacaceae archaeon]